MASPASAKQPDGAPSSATSVTKPRTDRTRLSRIAFVLNLSLLAAFPVSWTAPMVSSGMGEKAFVDRIPEWLLELPLFEAFSMTDYTILSFLRTLWETDVVLALIIGMLAVFLPLAKTLALSLVQLGVLGDRLRPVLAFLGKWAMADVFVISVFILVFKGIHFGRIEVRWGLYLFTACVLTSVAVSMMGVAQRRG